MQLNNCHNVENQILGHLDSPTEESKIFNPFLQISGWAISETNGISVEILIDDVVVEKLEPTLDREDVTKALALSQNTTSGFIRVIKLRQFNDGIHTIKA